MAKGTERSEFTKKLFEWWKESHREFPWRNTRDLYQVLISEILLHRTKADQVVPVYNKFIKRFPTVKDLSSASLNDVKKIVYPLGLHWRTEHMHQMARHIVAEFRGEIPSEKEKLESLPGISHYIASAVRCFALDYPEALLDTNTVRILGRIFGIKVTDGSRRSKQFRELYQSLLDKDHPREFNYAMIDLGALICVPREPLCDICPANRMCIFGRARINKSPCCNA
jgi:A/G-specific adenine glycosylase